MRSIDGAVEGGAFAFALWTLFYELSLVTQWNLWWPARAWVVVALGLVGWRAYAATRTSAPGTRPPRRSAGLPVRVSWTDIGVAFLAVAVLAGLVLLRGRIGIVAPVLIGIAILIATLSRTRARTDLAALDPGRGWVPPGAHVVAAVVCLGLAGLAFVMRGSSADDIYYINRATWVAQHGTPTLRDTIFSSGVLPSTYPGPPTASIEAWQGAVAHVLGLPAPTFAFLWTVPVLAVVSGWATWRLVRTWAPRRAILVYLLATLFVLFSAGSVLGHYSLLILWEGKVPAITVVLPLAWHYLTRALVCPRRADLLILLTLGIDFVGLTSSAALIAPIAAAAALLAALLLRSRAAALGAGCFALAPVLAGVATALGPGLPTGVEPQPVHVLPATSVFVYMFGDGSLTVLSFIAVVLGTWLMRGCARVLAACATLAGLTILLPGFFNLVSSVTGAGPVVWRMIFVIPTAVLVGMLATVQYPPLPLSPRQAAVAGPVAAAVSCGLVVVLVLQGTSLWSPKTGSRPGPFQWKVDQAALRDERAVARVQSPPGPWLLPELSMGVLAESTTWRTAVVPRGLYLPYLSTTRSDLRDRLLLLRLVSGRYVVVSQARAALHRLDVSLACVPAEDLQAQRTLGDAVRARLEAYGNLRCHVGRT